MTRAEKFMQYTKGAPDEILRRCTHIMTERGVQELTEEKRAEIMSKNKDMADRALRVLAGACREYSQLPQDMSPQALESELVFLGLYGMIDPIRPEVRAAVDKCRDAGIRAVMITGDHIDTAVAIAKRFGYSDRPVAGGYGSGTGQHERRGAGRKHRKKYCVYARVQPEHKVRIVSAWERRGKVTAMTGDGVNDAPSIKTADIGIGMGITGTDVTKKCCGYDFGGR